MYLHLVVRPATLLAVRSLDLRRQSIADRWAQISPGQVRQLEAGCRLMEQLCLQSYVEQAAIADASADGLSAVPEGELLSLAGIDVDLHLYP
jgi:hypothetical protein